MKTFFWFLSIFSEKIVLSCGREDPIFGLHRFFVGKQDSDVDVNTFLVVFTDFGGTRANP